jgi:hypothetical protein
MLVKSGDVLPMSQAVTSESNALQIARLSIEHRGQAWIEPILAEYRDSAKGAYWLIRTNWTGRGHSVIVTIDDRTSRVIGSRSLPR